MKSIRKFVLPFIIAAFGFKTAKAFDSTLQAPVKVTVLLPLYLDSAFKSNSYKFGNSIPGFILPNLEFYNGVQLAADSLQKEGINARIEIIDTRKRGATDRLFSGYNFNRPQLIIGVVQSQTELRVLSNQALTNNVPFISATYPNDGGVTANPDLLIVNSTLKTHCEALYRYLQDHYAGSGVTLVVRKGGGDDRILNYLKAAERNAKGAKINLSTARLNDDFTPVQLGVYLDSNRNNIVVGATLNKNFSLHIVETLSGMLPSYRSTVFGMPTWDELPLQRPQYVGVDVYYSTPFISFSGNPDVYRSIEDKFKTIVNSRPSDMVFKGFEITYRYVKTLSQHPYDFLQHVNDQDMKVFADFRFEAAMSNGDTENVNYWENNKLYFVKKTDGVIKGVY